MKNHRDTCKAVDAGYIQFDGLPGLFKTGCTRTPAYMNRFCHDHAPRVCQIRTLTEDSPSPAEEGVVDSVISKKTLRNVTYYKVYSSYRLITMANAILYVQCHVYLCHVFQLQLHCIIIIVPYKGSFIGQQ